jgi:hypothetical protein
MPNCSDQVHKPIDPLSWRTLRCHMAVRSNTQPLSAIEVGGLDSLGGPVPETKENKWLLRSNKPRIISFGLA